MRIKFRTWRKSAKQFIYWSQVSHENLLDWCKSQTETDEENGILSIFDFNDLESDLQRCVGFTGSNCDIYEGDYIENQAKQMYEVGWLGLGFVFYKLDKDMNKVAVCNNVGDFSLCRVIGNNKEGLEINEQRRKG